MSDIIISNLNIIKSFIRDTTIRRFIGVFTFWMSIGVLCTICFSPYASIQKYCLLAVISVVIMLISCAISTEIHFQFFKLLWSISIILNSYLIFGLSVKGAKRWLIIKIMNLSISFQPSEILKCSCLLLAIHYILRNQWLHFCTVYIISIILLILQPDFGNVILLSVMACTQLWIYQISIRSLLITFGLLLSSVLIASIFWPHIYKRIALFISGPTRDIKGVGYQAIHSLFAIEQGGVFGKGLGYGVVKNMLPDAYSDFIFSVIVEELGMIGGLFVILSFLFLIIQCIICSKNMMNLKNRLYIVSISSILALQAWVHISSCMFLIPPKGICLPFISHGGSSLLANSFLYGILLRFIYQSRQQSFWTYRFKKEI